MAEPVIEGELSCGGRRWPLRVNSLSSVIRVRYDRAPAPTDPNDYVYQGTATVTCGPHEKGLPTDDNLLGRPQDVLILLRTLPGRGACPTGEWQLPVFVFKIKRIEGEDALTFEFMQHGGLGRPLE